MTAGALYDSRSAISSLVPISYASGANDERTPTILGPESVRVWTRAQYSWPGFYVPGREREDSLPVAADRDRSRSRPNYTAEKVCRTPHQRSRFFFLCLNTRAGRALTRPARPQRVPQRSEERATAMHPGAGRALTRPARPQRVPQRSEERATAMHPGAGRALTRPARPCILGLGGFEPPTPLGRGGEFLRTERYTALCLISRAGRI